jgi:hypothetical protein
MYSSQIERYMLTFRKKTGSPERKYTSIDPFLWTFSLCLLSISKGGRDKVLYDGPETRPDKSSTIIKGLGRTSKVIRFLSGLSHYWLFIITMAMMILYVYFRRERTQNTFFLRYTYIEMESPFESSGKLSFFFRLAHKSYAFI